MRNMSGQKVKILLVFFLLTCYHLFSFGLDSTQILKLNKRYNEIINYWEENGVRSNAGYIITEKDKKYHEICLNHCSISQQRYTNIPDGCEYCTEKMFRDYHVLINGDLESIYLSKTTDFKNYQEVEVGEVLDGVEKWFLTDISKDSVKFNYGWLYPNAWFAESLIDMYNITGKEKYLLNAENLLELTCKYLDENGKWYRLTALDKEPVYIAQRQSIFMRVLYKFLLNKNNQLINESLVLAAKNYEHTDEGVYNHWTNSRIGGIIRDQFLGEERTDYDQIIETLEILYNRIEKYEGKIPYCINENNSQYPDFKETYQTYDTYLLSLLSHYSNMDIGFDEYFDMAFNEAIDKNIGPYLANNLRAVLYLYKSYGIRNVEFVLDQVDNKSIYATYNKNRYIVGQLQAIVAILYYNKLTSEDTPIDHPKNSNSFTLNQYPNPFNASQTIRFKLNRGRNIIINIYDLYGNRIKKLAEGYYKGINKVRWSGKNSEGSRVPSGVYIYRILTDKFVERRKVILMR